MYTTEMLIKRLIIQSEREGVILNYDQASNIISGLPADHEDFYQE